jgi:hypothetical protein
VTVPTEATLKSIVAASPDKAAGARAARSVFLRPPPYDRAARATLGRLAARRGGSEGRCPRKPTHSRLQPTTLIGGRGRPRPHTANRKTIAPFKVRDGGPRPTLRRALRPAGRPPARAARSVSFRPLPHDRAARATLGRLAARRGGPEGRSCRNPTRPSEPPRSPSPLRLGSAIATSAVATPRNRARRDAQLRKWHVRRKRAHSGSRGSRSPRWARRGGRAGHGVVPARHSGEELAPHNSDAGHSPSPALDHQGAHRSAGRPPASVQRGPCPSGVLRTTALLGRRWAAPPTGGADQKAGAVGKRQHPAAANGTASSPATGASRRTCRARSCA